MKFPGRTLVGEAATSVRDRSGGRGCPGRGGDEGPPKPGLPPSARVNGGGGGNVSPSFLLTSAIFAVLSGHIAGQRRSPDEGGSGRSCDRQRAQPIGKRRRARTGGGVASAIRRAGGGRAARGWAGPRRRHRDTDASEGRFLMRGEIGGTGNMSGPVRSRGHPPGASV